MIGNHDPGEVRRERLIALDRADIGRTCRRRIWMVAGRRLAAVGITALHDIANSTVKRGLYRCCVFGSSWHRAGANGFPGGHKRFRRRPLRSCYHHRSPATSIRSSASHCRDQRTGSVGGPINGDFQIAIPIEEHGRSSPTPTWRRAAHQPSQFANTTRFE